MKGNFNPDLCQNLEITLLSSQKRKILVMFGPMNSNHHLQAEN